MLWRVLSAHSQYTIRIHYKETRRILEGIGIALKRAGRDMLCCLPSLVQLEYEIVGEAAGIAFDGLIERLGRHAVVGMARSASCRIRDDFLAERKK